MKSTKKFLIPALGLCAAAVMSACVILPQIHTSADMQTAEYKPLAVSAAELSPAEYADYGIMPIAEKAYTLTATVNGDATVKAVDWDIAFQNPASEWATGKTVTEYMTVSSTGDLTATVSCLQAFGERIVVSAVSRDKPQVKADCVCEYEAKITGANISVYEDKEMYTPIVEGKSVMNGQGGALMDGKIEFGKDYYFDYHYLVGIGTIAPDPGGGGITPVMISAEISLNEAAKSKLGEKGYHPGETGTLYVPKKGYFEAYAPATSFDSEALKTLFGQNAAQDGTLYHAIEAVQSEGYNDILDLKITITYQQQQYGPYVCTLNVDHTSLYTPVSDVQVAETELRF